MKQIGKLLQLFGLVLLPLSIIMQLGGMLGRSIGVDQMLIMMVAGAASFYLGRLLEGYAS